METNLTSAQLLDNYTSLRMQEAILTREYDALVASADAAAAQLTNHREAVEAARQLVLGAVTPTLGV